jgi:hypothetical protein
MIDPALILVLCVWAPIIMAVMAAITCFAAIFLAVYNYKSQQLSAIAAPVAIASYSNSVDDDRIASMTGAVDACDPVGAIQRNLMAAYPLIPGIAADRHALELADAVEGAVAPGGAIHAWLNQSELTSSARHLRHGLAQRLAAGDEAPAIVTRARLISAAQAAYPALDADLPLVDALSQHRSRLRVVAEHLQALVLSAIRMDSGPLQVGRDAIVALASARMRSLDATQRATLQDVGFDQYFGFCDDRGVYLNDQDMAWDPVHQRVVRTAVARTSHRDPFWDRPEHQPRLNEVIREHHEMARRRMLA